MAFDLSRIVLRALVAGLVMTGIVMSAGCSKQRDDTSNSSSGAGALQPAQPVQPATPVVPNAASGAASAPGASGQ
ncbi:hypothetical protein [Burkholderia sp. TSV86]|uniref:hypothetical protein n=1 Tax=Burkholderia sp. TSV86 TaxID=1385594 RepID=UPI00075753FC|nr:hypothetical protein [Burkholderia sp. TSV86]KVE36331.1 hypothetical protein WS68_04840 [Burkholderia sp. TSV86]